MNLDFLALTEGERRTYIEEAARRFDVASATDRPPPVRLVRRPISEAHRGEIVVPTVEQSGCWRIETLAGSDVNAVLFALDNAGAAHLAYLEGRSTPRPSPAAPVTGASSALVIHVDEAGRVHLAWADADGAHHAVCSPE